MVHWTDDNAYSSKTHVKRYVEKALADHCASAGLNAKETWITCANSLPDIHSSSFTAVEGGVLTVGVPSPQNLSILPSRPRRQMERRFRLPIRIPTSGLLTTISISQVTGWNWTLRQPEMQFRKVFKSRLSQVDRISLIPNHTNAVGFLTKGST